MEKNELIDLLLNKSKRNYQSHGMIEGFIDDVINNQYMKEDLKQYLKEEHNIDLFIDNKEIEKLMKLLDLNINRHRNQISKSVVKKYIYKFIIFKYSFHSGNRFQLIIGLMNHK